MAKKPKDDLAQTERLIAKFLDTGYSYLLSGDPEKIRAAMARIDALRGMSRLLDGLALVGRVKDWINQEDHTKHIKYLNETFAIADPRGNELPDRDRDDRWLWKGRSARALFYAGRFKRARKRFDRVRERVKVDFSKVTEAANLTHAHDIRAAHAECLVYLGRPKLALDTLNEIEQVDALKPWHEWVRAFALHQYAFAQGVPFGNNPDPFKGTRPRKPEQLAKSNMILEQLRSLPDRTFAAAEKRDTWLLTAANYGGLFRAGDDTAKELAEAALEEFRQAEFPQSKNQRWSWQKEERGRFPIVSFPGEKPSESAVERWREAYKGHYRDNLVEGAGLGEIWDDDPNDDGDVDLNDEHEDDDDSIE
jgi:hypothetical protein